MLILARRIGESIMIGDQVEISVVDIKGDQVKLGIKAPAQVKVYRREVYAAIQEENRAAAGAVPQSLPRLEGLRGSPSAPGGVSSAPGGVPTPDASSAPGGAPPTGNPPAR
jgi:carbon storage regulator